MRLYQISGSNRRGFTLVEALVFITIWASVSLSSLWVVRESSRMRGQARQRAELALVAQSEIERVRTLPSSQLAAGQQLRPESDWWPAGTSCTVTLSPRGTAWQVDVQVARHTERPLRPVRLTTVRGGGR